MGEPSLFWLDRLRRIARINDFQPIAVHFHFLQQPFRPQVGFFGDGWGSGGSAGVELGFAAINLARGRRTPGVKGT
jgi:hypothetical protein